MTALTKKMLRHLLFLSFVFAVAAEKTLTILGGAGLYKAASLYMEAHPDVTVMIRGQGRTVPRVGHSILKKLQPRRRNSR